MINILICDLPFISVQKLNVENQEQRTELHKLATTGLILVYQLNKNLNLNFQSGLLSFYGLFPMKLHPFPFCGLQISLCNF